jgi:nifR3 family TIM-barrel protein
MDFWNGSIKIGDRLFPRFIGGPLDGITDSPFRQLVRDFSKEELLYTEMRHVASIAHDKGALKTLEFHDWERPLNYQISANQLDYIMPAIQKILAKGVDAIDLNIGCPARNVIGSGSGSALMADLPRLERLVKTLRQAIPIPFTVKIRAGFKEKNAVDVARMLQDCGVDALAIHPRLQTQKFDGQPDYTLAAQVKEALSIPVIISGGIINFKMAKLVHEMTGVDAFLIGRGIWSKPWKLHELQEHSQGRPFAVDTQTVISYALKHLELMVSYYGPRGLFMFRKHVPFYVKGLPQAAHIRKDMMQYSCPEKVRMELTQLLG